MTMIEFYRIVIIVKLKFYFINNILNKKKQNKKGKLFGSYPIILLSR
jgi:hypothetical protein